MGAQDGLSDKVIDGTVKVAGNLLTSTIKSIGDPIIKAILAIVGVMDIFTFVLIIFIISKNVGYGTISFCVFIICNAVIAVILVLKIRVKLALVKDASENFNSRYREDHE